MDGRFDALASCHLEGLRVREDRAVGTLSALEANDPYKDSVVHRSEPGEVLGTESPPHKYVQLRLNHLGPQHADFRTGRGHLHIVQLRAETFEACRHETNPSLDFERKVCIVVDSAAEVQ